jgi:hypothetical protein
MGVPGIFAVFHRDLGLVAEAVDAAWRDVEGKSPCASPTRSLGYGISPPRVRPSITSALGYRLAQDEVVVQLQRMDLTGSPILSVAQEFSRVGSSANYILTRSAE